MPSVTIGMDSYDVFADVATATVFLAAKIGTAGIWDDSPTPADPGQQQALVTATRWIINYLRDRVADADLPDPSAMSIDPLIEEATIELAFQLVVNSSIQNNATTGSNTKRVRAGSAEVEFFRPTEGTAFPEIVNRLLLAWLRDNSTLALTTTPITSGIDGNESDFECPDEFGFDEGLN